MDLGIKGKKALVLGSSAGIGKAIARELAQEGVKVALCARNRERLLKAQKETNAFGVIVKALGNKTAGRQAVKQAEQKLGGLDILVFNTGGPPSGTFRETAPKAWDAGYRNLWRSALEAISAALPFMRQNGWGRIIIITSFAAREPVPELMVSSAFRAGMLGLVKGLSREVAAEGITVNSVLPGYTKTERLKELGLELKEMADKVPAKRLARPEEPGKLTAFLCSEAAGYITGQSIACDGGLLRGI